MTEQVKMTVEQIAVEAMKSLILIADKRGWQFHSQDACEHTIAPAAITIALAMRKSLDELDDDLGLEP